MGDAVLGLLKPEFVEHRLETITVFREIDRVETRSDQGDAGGDQAVRQIQGRLSAVLHHAPDHAARSLRDLDAPAVQSFDDVQDILEGEWLEEELITGVVVRRDRFRIRIDHHRVEAHLRRGETRLTTAVVEFDPLADAVRSAAEDHDLRSTSHPRLVVEDAAGFAALVRHPERTLVRRIEVRRHGLEFRGTRVDEFVDGFDSQRLAVLSHRKNRIGRDRSEIDVRQLRIGVTEPLRFEQQVGGHILQPLVRQQLVFEGDQLDHLIKEPRIDSSEFTDPLEGPTQLDGIADVVEAALARHGELPNQQVLRGRPLRDGPVAGDRIQTLPR